MMQPPPAEDLSVPSELTIGQCATLACTWEVATPKPGNVHRGADFEDLTFLDFLTSAVAIFLIITCGYGLFYVWSHYDDLRETQVRRQMEVLNARE